jgi:hypothetical protein
MRAIRIGEGERTQANTREHKLFAMFANVRLGFSSFARTSLSCVLSFDMRIDVDHIVTIALFVSGVVAFAYLTYQIIELL